MSDSTAKDQTNGASEKAGTVLGGSVIVAGTAIGAGMFSLPIAMSGIWFGYSIALMIFVWFCMYALLCIYWRLTTISTGASLYYRRRHHRHFGSSD